MKITLQIIERRKKVLNHLNRIQGQISTLKKYIEEDQCCGEIAQLTTSIAKSFDSVRTKTLEGFILNELFDGANIDELKQEKLDQILKLYKK